MEPVRWQQIADIYQAALDLPRDERARHLADACGTDVDLRREIESLLAQENASALIDRPVWESARDLLDADPQLAAGSLLGPYRIEGLLGAGGMGQVYRATDTRLNRTVAVKILAGVFAGDRAFRERFDREARTIAALTHPHICTLHDIGRHGAIDFLVMEYVEGVTLAARLEHGALPIAEALDYAIQIAEALDKAHRHGIVHRDLKPGNVMLTKSGRAGALQAKLLDFGLAKSTGPPAAGQPATSPATGPATLTTPGAILGTAQYMAPEQLEGKDADARTDIFALGAVLYEMLAGAKAFAARSQAGVIGAIMHADPEPLATRNPSASPALERVVMTCLAKDADARWQNAADLARELRWIAGSLAPGGDRASAPRRERQVRARAMALAATVAALVVAAVATGAFTMLRTPPALAPATRFTFSLPDGWTLPSVISVTGGNTVTTAPFAVSRDGLGIGIVAVNRAGTRMLWIRALDRVDPQPLAGSEDASEPFWSHDGRFLAFFAQGKLKKVDVAGGAPIVICDAPNGRGGTWSQDDIILFARDGALHRVPAGGGAPAPVTESERGKYSHLRPVFLPDGRHFLYYEFRSGGPHAAFVGSLDSREAKMLAAVDATNIGYTRDHVLFLRNATLMAQPFDAERLAFSGDAFAVVDAIQTQPITPTLGLFAASDNGVLVYQTGATTTTSTLRWFDRAGNEVGSLGEPADFAGVRISPDGKRVIVNVLEGPNIGGGDLWIYDIATSARTRFTFDAAGENSFVWSPAGDRIVFGSHRKPPSLVIKAANGSGPEQILLDKPLGGTPGGQSPSDWSPDGSVILAFAASTLWRVPSARDTKPEPWTLPAQGMSSEGQFHPSGRWIAYQSSERGAVEVYVSSFPGAEGKWQVSVAGGTLPRWRADGKELFYLAPDGTLMAAEVTSADATFAIGAVRPLFKTQRKPLSTRFGRSYDVTANGTRFLVNTLPDSRPSSPITVVVNWRPGL